MPQVKQNFIGDRLDTHMPKILHNRMNPEEWNHFVREINTAIREAQSYRLVLAQNAGCTITHKHQHSDTIVRIFPTKLQ